MQSVMDVERSTSPGFAPLYPDIANLYAVKVEFSSLLDEGLVIAIASEQDLDDPTTYEAVRASLQELAKNVPAEEATGFNPSGIADTFGSLDGANDHKDSSTATSARAGSSARDCDSFSTGITSPVPESNVSAVARIPSLEGQTDEEKANVLREMFADLKNHDITLALKKTKGDFQNALEYLLNLQYLESTGQRLKGINGFFQLDDDFSTTTKKKGKQKRQKSAVNSSSSSSFNEWSEFGGDRTGLKSIEDVQFLAERLGLPSNEISGDFYKNNGSKEKTLVAILDRYIAEGIQPTDDIGKQSLERLSKRYRQVPEQYLKPVAEITGSASERAQDLASLLERHFSKFPPRKLDIDYRIAPLVDDEIVDYNSVSSLKSRSRSPMPTGRPQTYETAMHVANSYATASHQSYQAASQAHKKGNSNPLFKQAAGFYAERGREEARVYAKAKSAAADILVSEGSSGNSIDLHGVEVSDGVRIAKERTWAWWRSLGEYRQKEAKEGFTIITGLGRHSAGGVSQLRKSVAPALIADGWKVAIETGRFRITGRR